MKSIVMHPHAKINLSLDVTGVRADGYHKVEMVMQTIALHDDVTVTQTNEGGFVAESNLAYLPTDDKNIALRAAKLFYERTGIQSTGIHIKIHKRIPVAAGLAGGSTDAAAVLRALDEMHGTAQGDDTLCEIGLALGADVPYCLYGGTMLARGIGEQLTRLAPMPPCAVVLVKPAFSVSTKAVYDAMPQGVLPQRPDTAGLIGALTAHDYAGVCQRLYNVMEPITGGWHGEIASIRAALQECGADGTAMSGSGPTLFGLFSDLCRAKKAEELLSNQYKDTYLTEICE